MSATATRLIYRAAGEPPIAAYGIAADERPGSCRLCGQSGEGIAFEAWIKDTFMDHDQLYPGDVVCRACLFCVDDHSTALQALTGRDKPQRMRNYTHIVTADGRWLALGKDQKPAILAALTQARAPQVASIALGGQKHVVLRAQPGQWQVELDRVWPDPVRLRALVTAVGRLYAEPTVTKSMMESGEYGQRAIRAMGPGPWYAAEAAVRPSRGSTLFALAVWLAQRREAGDDATARCGGRTARADLARDSERLQDEVQLHNLGPVRESGPECGLHEHTGQISQPDLFAVERDDR
jgi:hypothetical protein